jgi:hypothetical protein
VGTGRIAVEVGVSRYDPVTQILDVNHVPLGVDGLGLSPIRLRLASPPEFDLMARIAGGHAWRPAHPLSKARRASRTAAAEDPSAQNAYLRAAQARARVCRRRASSRCTRW